MQKLNFTVTTLEESATHGQFSIDPLEKGFGDTLGTALRRVLLSSFQGAAITSVKVSGVTHKFSTLEGMSEDMIDLMLNLKSVKVAYQGDTPTTAKLKVTGPKVVTAKDFVVPAGVKIASPDVVIARLAGGAKLDLEVEIATGYGYSPAEERSSDTLGVIALDAIFSPVERVSYRVESTRVGRRTDFDKLVIDIYTDGSAKAGDVLKDAASTLIAYFSQIVSPAAPAQDDPLVASASSSVTTDELGLPTRIANALKNGGYKTAADLVGASDKDLKKVKNLGGKSLGLIDSALEAKGLKRAK